MSWDTKGENRLGMLMKMLLNDKRYADAERASEDEKYREQLYKEFEIQLNIMNEFSLSQKEVVNYVKNTGKHKNISKSF